MYLRHITEEQKKKLDQAASLLAEVQIEILREDEKRPKAERTGRWRLLYGVRVDLGATVHALWSD